MTYNMFGGTLNLSVCGVSAILTESFWQCFRAVPSAAVQGRHSKCIISFCKGPLYRHRKSTANALSRIFEFQLHLMSFSLICCHILTCIFICPIAIAYSMEQIIKSVCVCQCICLSVCEHSHGRIS